MSLKRNSLLNSVAFVLIAMPVAAGTAYGQPLTLVEALGVAYETNPRLEAERAQLRATDEEVAKALSGWRPNLGVSGSYGWTSNEINTLALPIPNGHPRDVTVTVTQPLFTGQTIPQTRRANAQVRAGRFQLTAIEQQVLLEASQAYFNVVADETALGYQRDNVQLLTAQLSMTQERLNVGDITITDLQLVQSRLANANSQVSFALARLAASRAAFERSVGRPAETLEMTPTFPPIPQGAAQATALAIENNPELNNAREESRVADASVDVATGALAPSLSIQGQYRHSRDQSGIGVEVESSSIMAMLRVPIYQGGIEYAGVRQAKQFRSRALSTITDVERQVRQTVEAAYQAQVAAREAMTFNEQQVRAAEMAYEGFAEGVRAGERSTYDMLNAAQELLSGRIALAESRRQYYLATFQLMSATGTLTARAMNLPVTPYDPDAYFNRNAGRWFGLGE